MTERLSLPNGDWVDLADRLTYAQRRRIVAAQGTPEVVAEGIAAMVLDWSIRGVDEKPIKFPKLAPDGIAVSTLDTMPADTFDAIGLKLAEIVERGQPDPKGSGEKSPGSLRGHLSPASPSNSRKRTSSKITAAGIGTISSEPPPTSSTP